MGGDLSVVDTNKFGIICRRIEQEYLGSLIHKLDEYLEEREKNFSDLYVVDLFMMIEKFLYDFINEIPFLSPYYYFIENKEMWDVSMIIIAYLYLSKNISKHYLEKVDYIDIFRREYNIKNMIELLAIVVKKLFEIYFIEEVKIIHTAVLKIIKEKMIEVTWYNRKGLVEILDSASYAGITFGELRRWFYYFNTDDIIKYLSKRYTLERALEEVEDDDEDKEDGEE